MSRKAQSQSQHQGAAANQAGNGLPSLSAANLSGSASHEQIAALNKRTTQMLRAVVELRAEIEQAPGLADWPHLISRHATLLSQLHSLTSSLTSTTPTYLSSQLSSLTDFLGMESKNSNMFLQDEGTTSDPSSNYSKLPSIKYSDPKNNLINLESHPISNSFQDQEKTDILGRMLIPKNGPDIVKKEEDLIKAYQNWSRSISNNNQDGLSNENETETERERKELDFIKQDKIRHDGLIEKVTRIWFHKQNEPDENGITYDFKMRLPKDSDGTEILSGSNEEEGEGMEGVQMEE